LGSRLAAKRGTSSGVVRDPNEDNHGFLIEGSPVSVGPFFQKTQLVYERPSASAGRFVIVRCRAPVYFSVWHRKKRGDRYPNVPRIARRGSGARPVLDPSTSQ